MSIAEIRRTVTPDGTSLAWRTAGPPGAPWLVLSNGAGCSEEYWTASFLPVAGLEDSMTPAAVMERIRDALHDVVYLPVRGGRHTLLMTRGGWIAGRLLEFLERRGLLRAD